MKKYQIYTNLNDNGWNPEDSRPPFEAKREDDAVNKYLEECADNLIDATRLEEVNGCKCLYTTYGYWNDDNYSIIEFKAEQVDN